MEPRFSSLDSSENVDLSWVDKIWKGPIIKSGAFLDGDSTEYLDETVGRDNRTLIGVSRYFTSNPDLLDRLKNGYELTPYDRPNFYNAFSNVGYLNFKKYGEKEDHSKDDIVLKVLA